MPLCQQSEGRQCLLAAVMDPHGLGRRVSPASALHYLRFTVQRRRWYRSCGRKTPCAGVAWLRQDGGDGTHAWAARECPRWQPGTLFVRRQNGRDARLAHSSHRRSRATLTRYRKGVNEVLSRGDAFATITVTAADVTRSMSSTGSQAPSPWCWSSGVPSGRTVVRSCGRSSARRRRSPNSTSSSPRCPSTRVDHTGTHRRGCAHLPVGHSANLDAIAAVTGAFVNPEPRYLQSTGFVLDPAGNVAVSVHSSGLLGRLAPGDVIGLVRYVTEHQAA